ncbi:N-acetyl-beta-glucosaminyl-glycoprotein 4-beta-N-acetylgalactosaminyltransferase 1 isoform X2 [Nematostella vectensis]|uniref:N-acetyl-beta-glucosaminyl-glycoprotein 4-beta-N-acetylgalactosaminyltransferase 1 isoform X2 n=1 Tax=Nematostella vectensis TaxID=45351 RepID=UPI00207703A8|nr:N-acetyl-beta-glucosaminyl-glycoprotein 4-beta-N-acetylgalactosaminyltransferase 1 isoform X2 [Nematostella vectensis]
MARILTIRKRKTFLSYTALVLCILVVLWQLNVNFFIGKHSLPASDYSPAVLVACRQKNQTLDLLNGLTDTKSIRRYKQAELLRTARLNFRGTNAPVKEGKVGFVNFHLWDELCGNDLRTLLYFPLFPNIPESRKLHDGLSFSKNGKHHGKRVFGFIAAPKAAKYTFRLDSSGSSELWLSTDEDRANANLACAIRYGGESPESERSYDVHLKASRLYYFDLIHKQGDLLFRDFINVQWRIGDGEVFTDIPSEYLKSLHDDTEISDNTVNTNTFLPTGLHHKKPAKSEREILWEKVSKYSFMNQRDIVNLFPTCAYKPNYLIKHQLSLFASLWEHVYTAVYPSDKSNRTMNTGVICFGNDIMDKTRAFRVARSVVAAIEREHGGKYTFKDILNVEQKQSRYFVELLFKENASGKIVRFSEYVYQQESGELCYPEGFVWNRKAMVNLLVISGRNQAKWVYHFINNIQEIYKQTGDENINVIIVDFLSPNADLKAALEESSLPNYSLLENISGFQKSLGIQQAVNHGVTDQDSIVVVMDLHLQVPASFIEDHSIKGRQAFSPVIERLQCGSMQHGLDDFGAFWEFHGYGIVGIYKQDWDRFGGMNYEMFKDKWGGEDIEMVDRILMAGIELERRKVIGFSHYFHTKKGMWNNRS